MESPLTSAGIPHFQTASTSRTSLHRPDDAPCLTSFNPFSEEDENDQSSYAIVTSLISRVKNTFVPNLAPTSAPAQPNQPFATTSKEISISEPTRRPSLHPQNSNVSSRSGPERPVSLHRLSSSLPAPPLVSLTPVTSEVPSFNIEYDRPSSSKGLFSSTITENGDGPGYGVAIPGFPIQDSDARSIRTTISTNRQGSVSKTMRRIRGEGLSRDYWMDDELCKECYDCKSVFTAWRRKHHCRLCGQVFCSRCASNIIKGSRYGQDGMIRVCNLCLEKLSKVEDDDEDDRRSVASSTASPFATHHPSDSYLSRYTNSPFSTSQVQIPNQKPDSFNLFAIAESKHGSENLHSPVGSSGASHDKDELIPSTVIPFRRSLSTEEAEPIRIQSPGHEQGVSAQSSKLPVEFPITVPVSGNGAVSSIAFPGSPSEHPLEYNDGMRSRISSSYGDLDGSGTPFVRSRVQSRIPDNFGPEPGWRTRRESTAYAQELNLVSMFHLRIMLRQMLTKEEIPNITEWETTLLKLALQIARDLTFTAHPQRQGADMDVRRYVKIKKIPGGAPKDSEFVDGAVITKNVTHKAMSRSQRNPRVMFVTFPMEFHRVEGQYMQFGQAVRQEKEYLNILVARIAALRPHIVLVEKSVSRIALDALASQKIAVARSVKESAIQFVARMTQGDVFSSIDRLALEPRLGHCGNFQIQTFDHPLIPERRKTYMRFEGCNKEMGCTIMLRGGNSDTLTRIKRVTRFLTFIVRNLKLETHLWIDSVIAVPQLTAEATPALSSAASNPVATSIHPSLRSLSNLRFLSDSPCSTNDTPNSQIDDEDLPDDEAQQRALTRKVRQSLDPYTKTFLSVSATLRFQPPQPIKRMKELDDALIAARRAWEDEIIRREERTGTPITITELQNVSENEFQVDTPTEPASHHFQEATITPNMNTDEDDIKAQIESLPDRIVSETPPRDLVLSSGNGYFATGTSCLSTEANPRVLGEAVPCPLKTAEDIELESQIAQLKVQHEEQRKVWEWYLRKNKDDFVVEKYQRIALWECKMPTVDYETQKPCTQPQLKYITFYGENDLTLGQFIDSSISDTLAQLLDPKAICPAKGCDQPIAMHCRVFVHDDTRLMVAVEQWDQTNGHGGSHYLYSPDLVTSWSCCRVCGTVTPLILASEEMQRYSFTKFLELHLYPTDVQFVEGAGCAHNIYKYHIRYFSKRGMAVRFQTDPVNVYEMVYPPSKIIVKSESRLELKNADFTRLHTRNILWYTALVDDLKLINIDAATGDEEADQKLTVDINALILRAEMERDEITRMINHVYKDTTPTDTLGLNQVRAYRQDKIVAWQQDFDRLPKVRPAQISRKPSTFGSMRAGLWPPGRRGPPDNHPSSASVSEAEDLARPSLHRKVTGLSFMSTSSASDPSEPEVDGALSRLIEKTIPLAMATANGVVKKEHEVVKPDLNEDSDSTIGAAKDDPPPELSVPSPVEEQKELSGYSSAEAEPVAPTEERTSRPISRLPRRTAQHPSVAELVKRYQEYLPASGVSDLAKTALAPEPPESEPEASSPLLRPSTRPRNRIRHGNRVVSKKTSISDFEQGYVANVAPRQRRPLSSRIPVPPPLDLNSDSRRTSPDKRPPMSRGYAYDNARLSPVSSVHKRGRSGSYQKGSTKDKPPAPRSPAAGGKPAFRRQPPPGSKVSHITKHFERISRDNERATRRYAVIRGGRKPRPVASARAKVEILDSVRDAVKDEESESSSESSEADDEGEGDDEAPAPVPRKNDSMNSTTSRPETEPEVAPVTESPAEMETSEASPPPGLTKETNGIPVNTPLRTVNEAAESVPPSVSTSPTVFTNPLPSATRTYTGTDASERNSIFRALTGFWPGNAPQSRFRSQSDVDDFMADSEHIFRDASMVVRTDEPTSIIALALNSPFYREMLTKSRAEKRIAREPRVANDSNEIFMPDDSSVAESASTWGVVQVDSVTGGDPTEDLKMPSSKLPWAVSFESSGLTITCTILFPEQFDALRRTYDCEKNMIESLARCVKFNASGGKSGSAFLKTKDDRYIAKEISRAELETMETFAPAYFDYMSSSFTAGRPTLLAKIFGCFKVTWKTTSHSGPGRPKINQMNLVVMENLLYDRKFSKIYDLKGSTRGRHVQSTGRENEVLLDENLNETAHLSPFFLREHSKRILRGALNSDTKFLADINVMDYSFVVGVDSGRNELVVGIVDYVRTYTWDKKLESWVKESAFLGGAGRGEPTIVSPRQYRQRFLTAMERYFPLTPDRWMKQQDVPEEYGADW